MSISQFNVGRNAFMHQAPFIATAIEANLLLKILTVKKCSQVMKLKKVCIFLLKFSQKQYFTYKYLIFK